jgi:hypothetical protein
MAWSYQIRARKYPTDADIEKGLAHWLKMEQRARDRFSVAESSAARTRQTDNLIFARSAQHECKKRGVA